eukprot:5772852-Pyramimonas_sp.AAC.2
MGCRPEAGQMRAGASEAAWPPTKASLAKIPGPHAGNLVLGSSASAPLASPRRSPTCERRAAAPPPRHQAADPDPGRNRPRPAPGTGHASPIRAAVQWGRRCAAFPAAALLSCSSLASQRRARRRRTRVGSLHHLFSSMSPCEIPRGQARRDHEGRQPPPCTTKPRTRLALARCSQP